MKKYTDEMIEFLREVAKGKTYKEIVEMFNKKYDLGMTPAKLSNLLSRKKISLKQEVVFIKKVAFLGIKAKRVSRELIELLSRKAINQQIGGLLEVKESIKMDTLL